MGRGVFLVSFQGDKGNAPFLVNVYLLNQALINFFEKLAIGQVIFFGG
jgi:hypothetical protein